MLFDDKSRLLGFSRKGEWPVVPPVGEIDVIENTRIASIFQIRGGGEYQRRGFSPFLGRHKVPYMDFLS